MKRCIVLVFLIVMVSASCGNEAKNDSDADEKGHTEPTSYTIKTNSEMADELPLDDTNDFDEASRGLIASERGLLIESKEGNVIWDMGAYSFIHGKAPESANPSLWRQAKLNNLHGLFEITKGIYQLRGFDISNMTIVEGKTGWIVIDPLTTQETALRAFSFARKQLGDKPVVAVIFTHSHMDHFGGVFGVVSADAAARGGLRVFAPHGFMQEATSENILAGTAMARRAEYQFGTNLNISPRGRIDTGLGKTIPFGHFGILKPTDIVDRTPQEEIIDGIRFVFQYAPESEAPAELTFYLPEARAFCGAEILNHNMHNLYTLRGAKVRDAMRWSQSIDEAIDLFGDAEIYFGSHHWPIWGNARIKDFLKKQRDLYKYIHDQTLRLANAGLTPREISERIRLPESLSAYFPNRGYYGTLKHNAKAVYQAYFGWYDGNPANLDPLPPAESAKRYVEYMGGSQALLKKAMASFEKGEYRWVTEVLNHLVFAQPDNREAKEMLASAYDQLGFQSESGVWRNEYLTAAYELRHGAPQKGLVIETTLEILRRTPLHRFFDSMAVRLNGPEADGMNMKVNLIFSDLKESHVLTLENSVLHHREAEPDPTADASVTLTHDLFLRMLIGRAGIKETIFSDDLKIGGSKIDLVRFLTLFDKPENNFNIITP